MGRWAQRMRRGGEGAVPGFGPPAGTVLATNRGTFQGDAHVGPPNLFQAFRVKCDVSGNATQLQIVSGVTNCFGWNVRANAYFDGSGVPGSLISTGNFRPCSGLPAPYARETFDGLFVPMVSGDFYWFGLEIDASAGGEEQWIRAVTIAGGFSANLVRSTTGTSWSTAVGSSTADFDIVV